MIPGLGSIKIRHLIKHFSTAAAVLNADPEMLTGITGINTTLIESICSWRSQESWKRNLELVNKYGVHIIPYTSNAFPKSLLNLRDHPIVLYLKGQLKSMDKRSIAVVGTRQASAYGKEMSAQISQQLAANGCTVISGLARGIDTAAHQGALRSGSTIAVIGSGLANIYPKENISLAEAISHRGAIISEFPMFTPPDARNFPQRNRIVSELCSLGALLIEAPETSGAMITMQMAEKRGKRLFALPGRVDNDSFKGNHLLIKRGKAQLIENAQDILNNFEDLFSTLSLPSVPTLQNVDLTSEEKLFLEKLPYEEITIDAIVELTQTPVMKISVMLMGLVLKGVIRELPGKNYRKAIFVKR